MLSFSTEFPVEKTEISDFFEAVAEWLDGSQHTQITKNEVLDVATSGTPEWERGDETIKCLLFDRTERRSAAFRYRQIKDGVAWETTASFDSDTVDSWVSVKTERHSMQAQAYVPPAKKPFVVRSLTDFLGAGVDGEFRVSCEAKILTDADLNMVIRLINGDSGHHLPVVYVSKPFDEAEAVNVNALARHLQGVAHVLVEPSRNFSRRLQDETRSANPFGGYIGIYFAADFSTLISPSSFESEFDARKDVFQRIRASLLSRRPLPRCSWSSVQGRIARSQRELLKGDTNLEEYTQTFDQEIEAKDEQIREAETEIQRLNAAISGAVKEGNSVNAKIGLSTGAEQELDSLEFIEVVLDALIQARVNIPYPSRRADILDAIIENNENPQKNVGKKNDIKSLLRGYKNMTGSIRKGLSDLGFSITEDGKHLKIRYRDDSRYSCSLPKSGSDHRGGLNAVSEISNKFF